MRHDLSLITYDISYTILSFSFKSKNKIYLELNEDNYQKYIKDKKISLTSETDDLENNTISYITYLRAINYLIHNVITTKFFNTQDFTIVSYNMIYDLHKMSLGIEKELMEKFIPINIQTEFIKEIKYIPLLLLNKNRDDINEKLKLFKLFDILYNTCDMMKSHDVIIKQYKDYKFAIERLKLRNKEQTIL